MLNQLYLTKALNEAEAHRSQALSVALEKKSLLMEKNPVLQRIDEELSNIGASVAKLFYDENPDITIDSLMNKSLSLQSEKQHFLRSLGYGEDYLEPPYSCKKCNDTGRINGKLCSCIKERVAELELQKISKIAPIDECDFESFDLNYYKGITDDKGNDVYDRTKKIYDYLKAYSEDFHKTSKNLYMFGKTGLGKTHLALACAKKAVESGYNVVYGTAGSILSALEDEKFRHISAKYSLDSVIDAELLIIDDLGAEFSTSFTLATIHNIIESRLLAKKPTIITTNLDIDGIKEKYGERITSRIIGSYEPLKFDGKDIRQLKRFQY